MSMELNGSKYYEAEKFMSRARGIKERIDILIEAANRAYDQVEKITTTIDKLVVDGGNGDGRKIEAWLIIADDLYMQAKELNQVDREINEVVARIDDNVLASILLDYYINFKTWDQVANRWCYSSAQIYRKREEALAQVDKILKDESK